MSKRQEYAERLKAQIDEWNRELDEYEQKVNHLSEEFKQEFQQELTQLRQQRDEVVQELRQVQQATDEAWDEVWRGAEQAWKTMMQSFNNARSKFRD